MISDKSPECDVLSEAILHELAPEICHFLDQLEPKLDQEAWCGLLSLYQYNEMGHQFVRDFGFQCITARLYKRWKSPSEVAKRHVGEKWKLLREIVEWQAQVAAGWRQPQQHLAW